MNAPTFLLITLTLLALPAAAQAQTGTKISAVTVGASTFTNCTIMRVEPDGVRVLHDTGTAKVPYESLPAEVQAALGFDPARAAQYRDAQRTAQLQAAAAVRAAAAASPAPEAAKAQPQPPAAGGPPARQAVLLRGEMLPIHRVKDDRLFILRLYPGGQLVKIEGMRPSTDRNGTSVTVTAYATGRTTMFENQVVYIYSAN